MTEQNWPETYSLDTEDPRDMYPVCFRCIQCKHFPEDGDEAKVCSAFPEGIPSEIWSCKNDHTSPVEGDHGIQYEPRDAIQKAKKYLDQGDKPPQGRETHFGPRGGRYYETEPGDPGHDAVPKKRVKKPKKAPNYLDMLELERNDHLGTLLSGKGGVWTKRPELMNLHGTRVGRGLYIDDVLVEQSHFWYCGQDDITRIVNYYQFHRLMGQDEADRQDRVRLQKRAEAARARTEAILEAGGRGEELEIPEPPLDFTRRELTEILTQDPGRTELHPELVYLDGTFIGPGVFMRGTEIDDEAKWRVSKHGYVIIAMGDDPTVDRELAQRDALIDRRLERVAAGLARGRPKEFVPYNEVFPDIVFREHSKICDQDFETAVLMYPDGEVMWRKDGDSHHVGFSEDELCQLPGSVLLHNHPGGGSFSEQDIATACAWNIREMRVSADKYEEYIMLPPKGTPCFTRELWAKIKPLIPIVEKYLRKDIDIRYYAHDITEKEAGDELYHRRWMTIANELGLRYSRRPSSPAYQKMNDWQTEAMI